MRVFVWQSVDKCSDHYHEDGGVVVFAENEARARELANQQPGCAIRADERPDEVRDIAEGAARVFIMPNAGCC